MLNVHIMHNGSVKGLMHSWCSDEAQLSSIVQLILPCSLTNHAALAFTVN